MPQADSVKWPTSYIYWLLDPVSKEIRYIGVTVKPRARRNELVRGRNCGWKLGKWVRDVRRQSGLTPLFEVIDTVPTIRRLDLEKQWIDLCIEEGATLMNVKGVDYPYCM